MPSSNNSSSRNFPKRQRRSPKNLSLRAKLPKSKNKCVYISLQQYKYIKQIAFQGLPGALENAPLPSVKNLFGVSNSVQSMCENIFVVKLKKHLCIFFADQPQKSANIGDPVASTSSQALVPQINPSSQQQRNVVSMDIEVPEGQDPVAYAAACRVIMGKEMN